MRSEKQEKVEARAIATELAEGDPAKCAALLRAKGDALHASGDFKAGAEAHMNALAASTRDPSLMAAARGRRLAGFTTLNVSTGLQMGDIALERFLHNALDERGETLLGHAVRNDLLRPVCALLPERTAYFQRQDEPAFLA